MYYKKLKGKVDELSKKNSRKKEVVDVATSYVIRTMDISDDNVQQRKYIGEAVTKLSEKIIDEVIQQYYEINYGAIDKAQKRILKALNKASTIGEDVAISDLLNRVNDWGSDKLTVSTEGIHSVFRSLDRVLNIRSKNRTTGVLRAGASTLKKTLKDIEHSEIDAADIPQVIKDALHWIKDADIVDKYVDYACRHYEWPEG